MLRSVRYILVFALPGAIAATYLGPSYLLLVRSGENIDPITVAGIQQDRDITYGSALFYRPRPYKIERARLAKADIVLLGSSRAMQFVAEPWTGSVYNAGGAMRDIESGEIFVDEILKVYRPKQMIISLDWWWFSATRRPDAASDVSTKIPLTLHELIQPTVLLWKGILTPSNVGALLFHPSNLRPAIGLSAQFRHAGWDAFGHYDYGDSLSIAANGPDIGFQETLSDLRRQSKPNDRAPSNEFSTTSWQRLETLIKRLQDSQVDVVLFLPPVAAEIHNWVAAQPEPNMVKELERRLPSLPVPTFDFHDPDSVGSDHCEFVDGIHGGEVTYLRVLNAMAADRRTKLDWVVDTQKIIDLIVANRGHARLASDNPDRTPEADFNSLNCSK